MLSKAMLDTVNDQIRHEFNSAYLYLGMSMYAESVNLPGFANWLRVQWQEELGHAMKLAEILTNRGGRVTLQAIEKPPTEYKSPLDVFNQVLAHEQQITTLINRLYEVALKENDYATQVEVQWFIKEQVEEEKTATAIIEQLKLVGDSGTPLLMLDRQLATRSAGG